jgi:hypothetical protein
VEEEEESGPFERLPKAGTVFMMTRRRRSGSERGFTPSSMLEKY